MEKEKMSREETEIMSLEKADHFLRHIKMHADEVKSGTFNKDKEDYLNKLRKAQRVALEISHEMPIFLLMLTCLRIGKIMNLEYLIASPLEWDASWERL